LGERLVSFIETEHRIVDKYLFFLPFTLGV